MGLLKLIILLLFKFISLFGIDNWSNLLVYTPASKSVIYVCKWVCVKLALFDSY